MIILNKIYLNTLSTPCLGKVEKTRPNYSKEKNTKSSVDNVKQSSSVVRNNVVVLNIFKIIFYRLPVLPILPVKSIFFTNLPVNEFYRNSSTLVGTSPVTRVITIYRTFQPQDKSSPRDHFLKQLRLINSATTNLTILLGDFNLDDSKNMQKTILLLLH